LIIALRLAKAGYGGGDPNRILAMPVDIVMAMIQYEIFLNQYEKAYIKLNTKEN